MPVWFDTGNDGNAFWADKVNDKKLQLTVDRERESP